MVKIVSWFCCDSSMPHDPRLTVLPDNDYRWAWACLLGLEKQGRLEGQNVSGFSHYCQIDNSKFLTILDTMLDAGLLDDDFRPTDFEDWQKKALKAGRNKRSYNKTKTPTDSVACKSHVSRIQANVSTSDTHTDTESKRRGRTPGPVKKNTKIKDEKENEIAEAMTNEWNTIFGGRRKTTSSLIKAIKAVLKDDNSLSPDDFALVVRSRSSESWVTEGRLPIESLIRAGKFAGYLEVAKETLEPRAKYTEDELAAMRTLTGGTEQ